MAGVPGSDLLQRLNSALLAENSVLFAGAGVGVRVDRPTWHSYLRYLADVLQNNGDDLSAKLVLQRIDDGDFLGAATVFTTTTRIPAGELLRLQAAPFLAHVPPERLARLEPLVAAGFRAIVTTNYDRTLHDAYAQAIGVTPLPIELDDGTLGNASVRPDFFIARIHGRAEKADTMVLDSPGYQRIESLDSYLDFLISLLRTRPCVFLGFSFLDPAITQVLRIFGERVGPRFPTLHLAVLPNDAEPRLVQELHRVNIGVVSYPHDDAHRFLWQTLRTIYNARKARPPSPALLTPPSQYRSSFHRFLAFSFAQLRSKEEARPLLEVVQEGIVLSLVNQQEDRKCPFERILEELRQALGLDGDQAKIVLSGTLDRLESAKEVQRSGDTVLGLRSDLAKSVHYMEILVNGVADRMKVRDGVSASDDDRTLVTRGLELLFLLRAWDLAAHFAGGGGGISQDLPLAVEEAFKTVRGRLRLSSPGSVMGSVIHLLSSPDEREAEVLSEVGRTAFALQIVLSSPQQTLFHRFILPSRVYLDSNVVLPLIVDGHPFRPAYLDTLTRLRAAAESAGHSVVIAIGEQFLNEIVSHRHLAVDFVTQLGLEDPQRLSNYVSLYGASNVNVFIGAYASHVGRQKRAVRFREFLRGAAPYDSEAELEVYLKQYSIVTDPMMFFAKHNELFTTLFGGLLQAYEEMADAEFRPKDRLLAEHEARQLTRLHLDLDQASRPLFVTADLRLQRALLRSTRTRHLSSSTVSQLGLINLIDLMVGLKPDPRSLCRLMWAAPRTEAQTIVRDYLIKRALEQYDTAIAQAMHSIVDTVAKEAGIAARQERVDLFGGKAPDDAARTAAFLDRFQNRFFESMSEAIAKEARRGKSP